MFIVGVMTMMQWIRAMLLPAAMLLVIGCEERPEVPPEILQKTAEPTPSGVPRPTTQ